MLEVEAIQKIQKVDGWLTGREARTLFRLARQVTGKGTIVEIGSWQGKSTILLALGSAHLPQVKIQAIDPHTGSPEHREGEKPVWTFDLFKQNLERAGVTAKVTPIIKFSTDALDDVREPVELLFIDGAHEYEAVKKDFELWFPKLIDGGTIAFHDTVGWPGPRQVVRDYVFKSTQFKNVRFADSIVYGTKTAKASLTEQWGNRFRWGLNQIYNLAFVIANKPAIKPLLKKLLGK